MDTELVNILLVDDRMENLIALEAVLDLPQYNLVMAQSGREALRCVLERDFALILLDVQMPELDGFETAALIKQREKSRHIPIIFITAINKDEPFIYKGYEAGAVDYVSKPFNPTVLCSKVSVFAELYRKTRTIARQGEILRINERLEAEKIRSKLEIESLKRERALSQKYRDLVEGITNGVVWVADAETRSLNFVSEQLYKLLEFSPTQLAAGWRFWQELIHDDDYDAIVSAFSEILIDKSDKHLQHRLMLPSGEIHWFQTSMRLTIGAKNREEIRGLSVDVTLLKTTEKALRKSEEQFRLLIEAMPQLVWTSSGDGKLAYVNKKVHHFLGNTGENSAELRLSRMLHLDDLEPCKSLWKECVTEGKIFETECRLRKADGQFRWHLARALPVRNSENTILKWLGTATDIEDQKQANQNSSFLSEASALLSRSFDCVNSLSEIAEFVVPHLAECCIVQLLNRSDDVLQTVAVHHVDLEKRIIISDLNSKYPDEWNVFSKIRKTDSPHPASELFSPINEMLLRRICADKIQIEAMNAIGMGSVLVVPLKARGRHFGALTFFRKEQDAFESASLRSLAEELGHRAAIALDNARLFNKAEVAVQIRDEFLSIASHELKTPLTPLKLQIQRIKRILSRKDGQNSVHELLPKFLDVSERQVTRLTKLVEELLDVSRIHSGKIEFDVEKFDLVELVEDVIQRHQADFVQCNCRVDLALPSVLPVKLDRLRTEQVLVNLLTNAIKYGRGKPVSVTVTESDGRAILKVTDEGIGISAEDQLRIFSRFERAVSSRNFGGLGLGLYIVKQILDSLGAAIEVKSAPGEGSTFTVNLPLCAQELYSQESISQNSSLSAPLFSDLNEG